MKISFQLKTKITQNIGDKNYPDSELSHQNTRKKNHVVIISNKSESKTVVILPLKPAGLSIVLSLFLYNIQCVPKHD